MCTFGHDYLTRFGGAEGEERRSGNSKDLEVVGRCGRPPEVGPLRTC